MGGNALKDHGARRVTAAEAKEVSVKVCAAIDEIFLEHGFDCKSRMIESYRQKADYGDLDIVVMEEAMRAIGLREVAAALEAKLGCEMPYYQHNPSSGNISVGYPMGEGCLQVDLIFAEGKSIDTAYRYFSWNDLGNLITILARQMDKLGFGQSGLTAYIKEDSLLLGTVTFTHDFDAALEFMGYDPERHRKGFDTLEEIYEFAVSTPYFDRDVFLLENQNHAARARNRKRSTYSGFLKWIAERDLPQYQWPERGHWMEKAMATFPGGLVQRHELGERERKRKEAIQVYNGSMVSALTGLKGEKLGLFMNDFKKFTEEASFIDFVLSQTKDELESKIMEFFKVYPDPVKPESSLESGPGL